IFASVIGSARLGGTNLDFYPLQDLGEGLPMTVKVLLEGLIRLVEAGVADEKSITALAHWPAPPHADAELPFLPARVLMQDFTGVPAVVDLAAMRSAMKRAGKDAGKVDPLVPVDLIIDHSVQVDSFGFRDSYTRNIQKEIERNRERYALLRWGTGGIEAEAAILGQPAYLGTPIVVGVRFHGALPAGSTATDLVLTLTEMLRKHGVVDKFVEFCGDGLSSLSVPDRATLSNM